MADDPDVCPCTPRFGRIPIHAGFTVFRDDVDMAFSRKTWRYLVGTCVLLSVTSLPGCQAWDAWMNFWGMGPQSQQPKVIATKSPLQMPQGENRIIVDNTPLPRVRLLRVSLPAGTVSSNEKIWRQLDEDALDSRTSVMLAQNGLRAGVAPINRWPGLSKMLDVTGAGSQDYICQTDGRSAVNVVVRDKIDFQIIVSVDRDSAQQGRTFERCENAFRLSMSMLKTSKDLMVQLEPIVQFGGSLNGQSTGNEITFLDIRLWTTIKQDQFLMVAPADPKSNKFSIGTRFLSDSDKVPPTETVLVFVPITDEK